MDFEVSAAYLLGRVTTAHKNLVERRMSELGVHGGQVFVLFELWKKDGLRQIDLAEKLGLAAPTVNKTLGGMLEDDLVTRGRMEDDARSTRIFLTEKGKMIRPKVEAIWREIDEQVFSNLTETEKLVLLDLLKKLRNNYNSQL